MKAGSEIRLSDLRKDFEEFLKKDFPSAYETRDKDGLKTWVDFAYSCYLEGTRQANVKSLELIKMLESKIK